MLHIAQCFKMTALSSASPHVTGIIDQVPSEELGRGLMLLSKVGF